MEINTPNSIWQQLSNACFVSSGLFAEQLVIRMFLSMAYTLILLNGLLGWPLWPDVIRKGHISVDAIVWSVLNLYAHGSSFIRLFCDEGPVKLDEDQSALWRMFYRHSGLSKLLFKTELSKYFHLVELKAGTDIPTEEYFYIVLDGCARVDALVGKKNVTLTLGSGRMFDFKHLHLFPRKSIFATEKLTAVSITDMRIFRCSTEDLSTISQSPLSKGAWQALLISTLTDMAENQWADELDSDEENQDSKKGERDPIFQPLEKWEEPNPYVAGSGVAYKRPLMHIWTSMKRSYLPPWPLAPWKPGLRQGSLPAPPVDPPGS